MLSNHHHQFIILANFPCQQGLASSFTAILFQLSLSHASCCTTPLFFISSSTTSIHHFIGLPLFLRPSIISNSNTFFISTSSSLLTICLNHLNLFCLKCSSKSSTHTLNAVTILSPLSFNITPQIILSILLSVPLYEILSKGYFTSMTY